MAKAKRPKAPRKPRTAEKAAASDAAAKSKKKPPKTKQKPPKAEPTFSEQLAAAVCVGAAKSATARAGGRPTIYSETLAQAICTRLIEGESLRSICRDPDMPACSTVCYWLADPKQEHPFLEHYNVARVAQAELLTADIIEIADDGTNDYVEKQRNNGESFIALDAEHVQRSRLRVDARKWVAANLLPKKYGDKLQHTGKDGAPLPAPVHTTVILPTMDPVEAARLYRERLAGVG